MIKFKNENNTDEITRNPEIMASLFNHFFLDKVKKIREGMKDPIKIQPAERLERWLRSRELQVPEFRLNPIDISTLRKVMKRLKGKKVVGCDTIDNYSLKMAGHLIEESLLHMINLSINSGTFPSAC